MIYTNLKESTRIENVHPQFKKLFEYLKNNDLLNTELGKIELDGQNLFINNVDAKLSPKDERFLESHKNYIDVQIPLSKTETFGIKPMDECTAIKSEYNSEKDIEFYYDRPTNFISVKPGEIIILFPEDAHAPQIGEGNIRKIIAKVKI